MASIYITQKVPLPLHHLPKGNSAIFWTSYHHQAQAHKQIPASALSQSVSPWRTNGVGTTTVEKLITISSNFATKFHGSHPSVTTV